MEIIKKQDIQVVVKIVNIFKNDTMRAMKIKVKNMNEEKDNFKTIFSAKVNTGSYVAVKFSATKEHEIIMLSDENINLAIEYYILARYAFFA